MNENNQKNIMIIAGEVSGDFIGAALIEELKKLDDNINFFGVGGDRMKEEGMDILYHIKKMAFLGFAEVVKHLPFIKQVQSDLLETIRVKNIKYAVLIDYPGFNLNFAKKLKSIGVKIIYYISPQIWAWGAGRIKKIKKLVDKMLVVFPFEEELYKKNNVNVELVGHPLVERINDHKFLSRNELTEKFNLNDKEILLIMPGSREHEVEKIFPETIKAADKVANEFNLQVVVACSSNIDESIFYKQSFSKNFKVVKSFTYDLMKYSKLGIIKSGTSTLEAGIFELPMVIVYKTSGLTYIIGKNLVRVDNIGMVNIISGEEIVPELIQKDVNAETIYSECKNILTDKTVYQSIKEKLKLLKEKLGSTGASERAAKIIYSLLNEA
jgi:lipid-A-disaccharide synthase